MYLRETRRRNADGSEVGYLALAHNERDPQTGVPRAQIVHRFGRTDQVDREALRRLVRSISRFLDPADAVAAATPGEVTLVDSRPMDACWLADRLWERFGIGETIRAAVGGRRADAEQVERTLFAMVANRLSVKPLSKLAGCGWVAERAFVAGLPEVSDDACYRAMDRLGDALAGVQERVFFNVASLLDLETVRLFALERLEAQPDADAIAARHADHFLSFAERAAPELRDPAPRELVDRLDREIHNFLGAMTWMLEHDRAQACVRLAVALDEYWALVAPHEGVRWLRTGLDAARADLPARLRARALAALAGQLGAVAPGPAAEATARQALEVARIAGDPGALAEALMELTYTLIVQYREVEAYPVALEAVAAATRDPTLRAEARLMEASCAPTVQAAVNAAQLAARHFERSGHASRLLDLYGSLADLALAHHDDAAARTFVARAKVAARRVPSERERTWLLGTEGYALLVTGDVEGARRAFRSELVRVDRWSVEEVLPEALYGLAATDAADGAWSEQLGCAAPLARWHPTRCIRRSARAWSGSASPLPALAPVGWHGSAGRRQGRH